MNRNSIKLAVLAAAVAALTGTVPAAAQSGAASAPAASAPERAEMSTHGAMTDSGHPMQHDGMRGSDGSMHGGMMGSDGRMHGGMMSDGHMGGGAMMGMMRSCHRMMMGSGGMAGGAMAFRLPPGNEKLEAQMRAEMLQKMGEIAVKYADRIPERK